MPWNGSGTFNRIFSWVADKAAGLDIIASRMDTDTNDIASQGFGNCITRDGQGQPTANLPMAGFRHTGVQNAVTRSDYAAFGQVQDGLPNWTIAGGSADAITATYTPALVTLNDGQLCFFRALLPNATTTPTFSPNGLTPEVITKLGGAAVAPGDIPGDFAEMVVRYNSAHTRWELSNPATADVAAGTVVTASIANSAVTYAKIQNETASTLLGNPTGSGAAPSEITLGAGLAFVGSALTSGAVAGPIASASGLLIVNDAGTPNSIIDISADQATLLNASNIPFFASAVSLTGAGGVNTSTTGANGLDIGSRAASTWYNFFIIYNGTTVAGLASLSATAPTMPSGYTFKMRVGAMRTDGSGNFLRSKQVGNRAHYVVTAASNTATLPTINSTTSITFWTGTAVTSFVPPTATIIWVAAWAEVSNGASAGVAANSAYPASGTGGSLWFISNNATSVVEQSSTIPVVFEAAQTVFFGSTGGTTAVLFSAEGWTDKVNAT